MIIIQQRPATCKDCDYCKYFYPVKNDGTEYKMKGHKCQITGKIILLSNRVCDKWKIGYGGSDPFKK